MIERRGTNRTNLELTPPGTPINIKKIKENRYSSEYVALDLLRTLINAQLT